MLPITAGRWRGRRGTEAAQTCTNLSRVLLWLQSILLCPRQGTVIISYPGQADSVRVSSGPGSSSAAATLHVGAKAHTIMICHDIVVTPTVEKDRLFKNTSGYPIILSTMAYRYIHRVRRRVQVSAEFHYRCLDRDVWHDGECHDYPSERKRTGTKTSCHTPHQDSQQLP